MSAASFASILIGGAIGIAGRRLSLRWHGYRLASRAIDSLRERSVNEDRIIEGMRIDPFIGREYARTESRAEARA